ncbi:hypothetical protein HDU79_003536 [Rhizoclosmatium sp. JEL0117]|nr:hypothetical protein HDU79_003536 [Rhizoclosmatium sp. JEL0117]
MNTFFLVSGFYQDGSCSSNNLYAFSFKPFPSCSTAPSTILNGTCEFTGGKQLLNYYTTNLCANQDYDFLGQLTQSLAGQDYIMIQSFENDSKCSNPAKISNYFALTFNKGLYLAQVPIENWNPDGLQLARVTGDVTKVSLRGRDGKEIKALPVNTCVSVGSGSYILAFPDNLNGVRTTSTTVSITVSAPTTSVLATVLASVTSIGASYVAASSTISLRAPNSDQKPATTTRNILSGASTSSIALIIVALFVALLV